MASDANALPFLQPEAVTLCAELAKAYWHGVFAGSPLRPAFGELSRRNKSAIREILGVLNEPKHINSSNFHFLWPVFEAASLTQPIRPMALTTLALSEPLQVAYDQRGLPADGLAHPQENGQNLLELVRHFEASLSYFLKRGLTMPSNDPGLTERAYAEMVSASENAFALLKMNEGKRTAKADDPDFVRDAVPFLVDPVIDFARRVNAFILTNSKGNGGKQIRKALREHRAAFSDGKDEPGAREAFFAKHRPLEAEYFRFDLSKNMLFYKRTEIDLNTTTRFFLSKLARHRLEQGALPVTPDEDSDSSDTTRKRVLDASAYKMLGRQLGYDVRSMLVVHERRKGYRMVDAVRVVDEEMVHLKDELLEQGSRLKSHRKQNTRKWD